MRLVSMMFLILLSSFIIAIILLIGYSFTNRNNKGRLISIGLSLLLLIVSSTSMYKNEKHKNFTYSAMRISYDELLSELNITYKSASELEENKKFKREARVLFNRASILSINSDIIPYSSLFVSKEMGEVFGEIISRIYNIGFISDHEDYLIESINIESMTNYLRQIGSILDSPNRSSSYINKGKRIKMEYNKQEINKIKSLLADMDKVVVKEVDKVKELVEEE